MNIATLRNMTDAELIRYIENNKRAGIIVLELIERLLNRNNQLAEEKRQNDELRDWWMS